MEELHLAGIQDNGEYIVLSGTGDQEYRLLINDTLRAAVTRKNNQLEPTTTQQPQKDLSPRAFQMRLRAGETVEAIAESTGADPVTIRRYEAPVLAERAHIVNLALQNVLGRFTPGHGSYWAEFQDEDVTLQDLVTYELGKQNIEEESISWDSWKDDAQWNVQLSFTLPKESEKDTDKLTQQLLTAVWAYEVPTQLLTPLNGLAHDLSAMHGGAFKTVDDKVFDIDALEDTANAAAENEAEAQKNSGQSLLSALRNMKGQRISLTDNKEEALKVLQTHPAEDSSVPADEEKKTIAKTPADVKSDTAKIEGTPSSGEGVTNRHAIAKKYPNLFGSSEEERKDKGQQQTIELDVQETSKVLNMADHRNKPKRTVVAETGSEKVEKTEVDASEPAETSETPATADNATSSATSDDKPKAQARGKSAQSALDVNISDANTSESKEATTEKDAETGETTSAEAAGKDGQKKKKKRTKFPSWDDIVFGPKS